jgi:hypothetical protein
MSASSASNSPYSFFSASLAARTAGVACDGGGGGAAAPSPAGNGTAAPAAATDIACDAAGETF